MANHLAKFFFVGMPPRDCQRGSPGQKKLVVQIMQQTGGSSGKGGRGGRDRRNSVNANEKL